MLPVTVAHHVKILTISFLIVINIQIIDLDLAYLKDWSKRWLVKFNQNKTEIMVFSSRDTKFYFNLDFEGASLRDVESHKHLGIIFSNDCKWTFCKIM
jgi:hypothetical protein